MAKTYDPENERLKRAYLNYMREAQQHSEPSLDAIAKALHRFETYSRFRSFRTFHTEQAIAFKRHLADQRNERTGVALSVATQYATLAALKAFFRWLASQPGFKKRTTLACHGVPRASPKPRAKRKYRHWSKYTTLLASCRLPQISNSGTVPLWLLSC
jgi:site-specific recombinase XerD